MAAKINKTVRISLKEGYAGSKNVPTAGSVLGGGTRMAGSSAGFKTKNDKGGKGQGASTGVKSSGFGAARGIQKNSGNTGGNQY